MQYYLSLIISFLFLASCQHKDTDRYKEIYLQHTILTDEDELLLGKVKSISLVQDSILTVIDANNNNFLHWINLKNKKISGKCGRIGQGPDEFLFISVPHTTTNGDLVLYDPNKRQCFSWRKNIGNTFELNFMFKVDSLFHFEILPLGNDNYIGVGLYEKNRFCLLNKEGKILQQFGEYPYRDKEERKVNGIIRSEIYQGKISSNKSGTGFAQALHNAKIISFFRQGTGHNWICVKDIQESFPEYKYNSPIINASSPVCYLDINATDKYVYVLYSGKSYKEEGNKAFSGNIIEVYDWNGNRKESYKLSIPVCCFCINESTHQIYGVADNPNPVLVQFTLP